MEGAFFFFLVAFVRGVGCVSGEHFNAVFGELLKPVGLRLKKSSEVFLFN
jgi:hypothetical protein